MTRDQREAPAPLRVEPEIERVMHVYRAYLDGRSARWDPGNRGNAAILAELERRAVSLLGRRGRLPLGEQKTLDVGCGYGHFLGLLERLGARPANLHGIDLLPERIGQATREHPGIRFQVGNAAELPYADGAFDLVLLFSVLTSILDPAVREAVVRACVRVLKPRGAILFYDFRFDSPRNPHVRGIRRHEVERVFAGLACTLETVTLAPPLARRLGALTPALYPLLASLPPLRTHYLGLLERRASSPL